MSGVRLDILGSINLDLVASGAPLPTAGETVTGAVLSRYPGGKGANQALAAQRLGASVAIIGAVGNDPFAEDALALLKSGGVDLSGVATVPDRPTGIAMICVDPAGENQITVASGANAAVTPDQIASIRQDAALLCQLEIPVDTVAAAIATHTGFTAINLAPALDLPIDTLDRADLLIANEGEAAVYGEALHRGDGLVAITLGTSGAALYQSGELIAEATAFEVETVDTTGAGDTFSAALTVALLEGQSPARALQFASAAAALAVTKAGAQPSLPMRAEVEAFLAR